MQRLTSKIYYLRALIFALLLVALTIWFFSSAPGNGWSFVLSAVLLIGLIYFYLLFVDIYTDESKSISIIRLGKQVALKKIISVKLLPISSMGSSGGYSIYFIRYLNDCNQLKRGFFYISLKKGYRIDEIFKDAPR